MRELEQIAGVTVIVYDQHARPKSAVCARAESWKSQPLRVVINEAVCEGCGDCVRQSNCMSLHPGSDRIRARRRASINRRAIKIIPACWAIARRS